MRRPRHIVAGILTAASVLLASGVQATTAGAEPATAALRAAAASATAQQKVIDFWTSERMREATPLDLITVSPDAVSALEPGGEQTTVSPTAPPVGSMAFPQGGGAWTGGGAVAVSSGRVFFTFEGRTASCSGNAVTSQNASTVITAGHCVKMEGAWHTNWVFVPGYDNGEAPYGTWAATQTLATSQWSASEDINYDVGAAVVAPLNGKTLTEVVGAQGLNFNGGYNKAMYAFGFPAAEPYDGSRLVYCSGNTSKDFFLTQDHGLSCDMTGGSSGGPWFTSFNESTGTGLQASVNSFGYSFLPGTLFGPYFGNEVKALYDQAQTS